LGAEHPLARALDRLGVLLRQSLAVAALLSAGVAALAAGVPVALWVVVGAGAVEAVLLCGMALLAQARRERALDLVIQGGGDLPLAAVQHERRRLSHPECREWLARWLDDIREAGERPVGYQRAARPLFNVGMMAELGSELAAVAGALRRGGADPRGVALAQRLLCDGTSPLYGRDVELLRQELHRICFLLES
jgi:hypothetical protein